MQLKTYTEEDAHDRADSLNREFLEAPVEYLAEPCGNEYVVSKLDDCGNFLEYV